MAGFTFSWIAWLAWLSVSPIETLAILQYAANYLPFLMHKVHDSHVLTLPGFMIATLLMIIICSINCASLKFMSKTNNIILIVKLGTPILTAIILLTTQFHSQNFYAHGGFWDGGAHNILAALPIAGVIYSFIGFNPAIQLAEEVKKPDSAIPFAIFGSLAICIVLYVIVQIAFIGAINPSSLAHGWHHLSFSGDKGPFAGILMGLGFFWFIKLIYIDAALSPFGTALVQASATGRLTYAMSQNCYLPKFLQNLNSQNSPQYAIIINTLIGLLFFLPFPSWQKMVGFWFHA